MLATIMDHDHTYAVQGMTCSHCVDAITREVIQVEGVQVAHVDLDKGKLWVQGHPQPGTIERIVAGLGYTIHAE